MYEKLIDYNFKNLKLLPSKNEKVLIDAFMDVPAYIATVSIIGRIINEIKGCEPLPLSTFNADSETAKLLKSMGINKFININDYKNNILIIINAIIASTLLLIKIHSKESLVNYYHNNIKVGDLIFDGYVRNNNNYKTFNIKSLSFIKHLLISFRLYFIYSYIIKSHKITYLISSDKIYPTYGLLVRIAYSCEIKVILSRGTSIRIYNPLVNDAIEVNQYWPSKEIVENIINNKLFKFSDNYLNKRFAGNINQHDVINAFKNKTIYSKEDLTKKYSLNSRFPIVFIMPHAFSDAPHGNKRMLFTGYYEWFFETINEANNIKNINWFVKPHPSSHLYGEEGEVKTIIENMNYTNIHLVPEDINTYTVLKAATTVLTVNGSIALEMACIGKKPIIASDSMYSGYGITHEPCTKTEYFKLLNSIGEIDHQLTDDQIIIAKSILFWVKKGIHLDSEIFNIPTIVTSTNPYDIEKQKIKQYELLYKNLKQMNYMDDPFYQSVEKIILNNEKSSKNFSCI